MASNWTCARCSAQNPESMVSCQTCGMIRGGVVTQPNPVAPPPPAAHSEPTPGGWGSTPIPPVPGGFGSPAPGGYPGAPVPPIQQTSPGKQVAKGVFASIGVRLLVLGVIAAIGLGVAYVTNAGRDSSGNINKAGDMAPSDLQVGDCYDLPGSTPDASAVIENTHAVPCGDAHHYEVFYRGEISGDTYPTDVQLSDWTDQYCTPAFESYVGTTADTTTLTYYYFFPSDSSWSSGDRGVQCSLADPNGAALTGSLKGSKR